ncbi:wall-associated receptor kinase 2-like protein [Tanacetum coccineum]|uniref:Wall-associated receptor kinase 2-like protein n=1 Tax=Tanacetum coccineum TaxID=301880 RepID=A0ABQ5BCN7_9ASTR
MLTVIGCYDYGLIEGAYGVNFSGGCIGLGSEAQDVPDGQCSGKGCCQISITKGLKYYDVTLGTFPNRTSVWSFNKCAMTRPLSLLSYRCRCNKGYEGNPYLDQGCQGMWGYNIGIRLIDEFLAKSNVTRCVDLRETAEIIAKACLLLMIQEDVKGRLKAFQHIYVLTDMELCVSSDVVINLWHDSTDADKAEETEKEDEVVFSGGKMQGFEVIVPGKATLLLHLLSTYEQKIINSVKNLNSFKEAEWNDVVINLWHDSTDADKAEETEKEDEVVFSGGMMLKIRSKKLSVLENGIQK